VFCSGAWNWSRRATCCFCNGSRLRSRSLSLLVRSAALQLERERQALDVQLAASREAAALVRQKSDARRRHDERSGGGAGAGGGVSSPEGGGRARDVRDAAARGRGNDDGGMGEQDRGGDERERGESVLRRRAFFGESSGSLDDSATAARLEALRERDARRAAQDALTNSARRRAVVGRWSSSSRTSPHGV